MNIENKKILVTGAAVFIDSSLVEKLLEKGNQVIGYDNFNSYYTGKEENVTPFKNNIITKGLVFKK